MWMSAGRGVTADIGEGCDAVLLEQIQEAVQWVAGVADGEDLEVDGHRRWRLPRLE